MFCSKCGTKAIEGAAFCQKCGARLIKDDTEKQVSADLAATPSAETIESQNRHTASIPVIAQKPNQIIEATPPVVTTPETTPMDKSFPKLDRESATPEPASSLSTTSADIYSLLKSNIGLCPEIKSVKQVKNGVLVRGKIYQHGVRVKDGKAGIGSMPAFPFSILYWLFGGLLCYMASGIGWNLVEYGSIYLEDYYAPLFAFTLWIVGLTLIIHTFCGHKEKADITAYVREILEPQGIHITSAPKKSGKSIGLIASIILILVGVIILIFPLLDNLDFGIENNVAPASSNDAQSTDTESVSLTQFYTNEAERFSFLYPNDWVENNDPSALVQLVSGSTLGTRAVLSVNKSEYDESTFYTTKEAFQAGIAASTDGNLSNIEVTDLTDITLQGYPVQKVAWKCINTDGIHFMVINYYYSLDTDLYVVSCMVVEDYFSQYEPILDAIMDSYTITANDATVTKSDTVDQLLFCDIPIQEVIGMGYDEIITTFGEPNFVNDSNYSSYYEMNYGEAYASDNSDWMIFGLYFEDQNVITSIHASPGLFSFNGQNLRQDYGSLENIFGEQLEAGTTSMYNFESILYYGDYVCTINYPISPDEWDENAVPTDVYVQLFSQSTYNQ